MEGRVRNRQFRSPTLLLFKITGASVSTTAGRDGLDVGKYVATIAKGAGADSNLITLTLNRALGTVPQVKIQEITLDCVARIEGSPTSKVVQIRTLELDGVTKEDDADLFVALFAADLGESAEGRHLS